ncbi:hypothetical protein N9Y67_03645, partial [Pseudomonadota bacterium]|nr:hypothetical protein [Pseudomonadota bacterium]
IKDFAYGTYDVVGAYRNTHVYSSNHADYTVNAGYYPTNNIRLSGQYDSADVDQNNYAVSLGVAYHFGAGAKGQWSPFVRAGANISDNTSLNVEYSHDIRNRPLHLRDTFENQITTANIVAQQVAPGEFSERTAVADAPASKNFTFDAQGESFVFIQDILDGLNTTKAVTLTINNSSNTNVEFVSDEGNAAVNNSTSVAAITTANYVVTNNDDEIILQGIITITNLGPSRGPI